MRGLALYGTFSHAMNDFPSGMSRFGDSHGYLAQPWLSPKRLIVWSLLHKNRSRRCLPAPVIISNCYSHGLRDGLPVITPIGVRVSVIWLAVMLLLCGCVQEPGNPPQAMKSELPKGAVVATEVEQAATPQVDVEILFDGETLDGWELTSFGGEGNVEVIDGAIVMNAGDPVTAINLPESRELPTKDYELVVEAKKIEGSDFFSTITFPVNDTFCSLVVGGWGGTLVGLSSIDGQDASTNQTRMLKKFKAGQWYRIRVQVQGNSIAAWIDDQQVVDQDITGKEISLRSEMVPCRPLGIASFITTAAIRKIELKKLESIVAASQTQSSTEK